MNLSWRTVLPHVVRALAMSLAALALAWGLTTNGGIASAMLLAIGGVVVGHRLGESRIKLSVIAASIVAFFLLSWGFARVSIALTIVPRIFGSSLTLSLVEMLRFGAVALSLTMLLRSVAVRRPTFIGLELACVAVAITSAFAAHRHLITRPLWLADWAYHHGLDPAQVLLAVGFVAVAMLGSLLLVETKSGRGASSLGLLAVLAVIAVLTITVTGTPKPQPQTEAGMNDQPGDPSPPPPPDDGGANGGSGDDAGGEPPPPQGDGDGGQGEGGGKPPPQPPPSERLTKDPNSGSSPPPTPVAVVLLHDDYSPPSQAFYFRQEALSQWNGTRLVATGRVDADRDGLSAFPTERTQVNVPPAAAGRVLIHQTVALLTDHANPFGLEAPVAYLPMGNPEPNRFTRAFKVESLAQETRYDKLLGRKAGDPSWSDELRAYYTIGPDDPRYGAIAASYMKTLPEKLRNDPFAMAVAVKRQLDHEFTYSTKVRYEGTKDPTAQFLFGSKIGYCVHFAHAAVFLWRSLGLPSRVAAGYHSDEDNRKGSVIVLRGNDAHMWPELYLSGIGWVVLDIAAEKNLDPPGSPPDEDLQRLLGNLARKTAPDPEDPKPRPVHHYGRDIGFGLLGLLVFALIGLYAAKCWRRIRPALSPAAAQPRVAYRAALDMLAEVGLARDYGETREAFAERIKTTVPSFRNLTDLHVAARLRDPKAPAQERSELVPMLWKVGLTMLRKDLSAHTKFWRRLLGLLNPTSFFASR